MRVAAVIAAFAYAAAGNAAGFDSMSEEQLEAAGIKDAATAAAFYERAVSAILKDDIETVSRLTAYPLLYGNNENFSSGQYSRLQTPEQLRTKYHTIFTPAIKQLLACRDNADFFINSEGFMVGGGSVWFSPRYIGDSAAKPSDYNYDEWEIKIIAVYDGDHTVQSAKECQAQQQ